MDWQCVKEAMLLIDSGRVPEALEQLEALSQSTSDKNEKASIFLTEVTCYLLMSKLPDAELLFDRAALLTPDNPEVQLNLRFQEASLLLAKKRYKEALNTLDRILKEYPSIAKDDGREYLFRDIQQRRAFALVDLDRPNEALPLLKQALTYETTSEDQQAIRLYLGTCFYQLREYSLAKEQFSALVNNVISNRFEAEARYRLAAINFREGALGRAKMWLEELESVHNTDLFPTSHSKGIYDLLSKVSKHLGEPDKAKYYETLSKHGPE